LWLDRKAGEFFFPCARYSGSGSKGGLSETGGHLTRGDLLTGREKGKKSRTKGGGGIIADRRKRII